MKFDPRLKVMVVGVGLALVAGNALADGWGYATLGDSASQEGWGGTVIGAANNPRGTDPAAIPDANGLSEFRQPVSHTPTGQMYSVPWDEPQSDNTLSGSIDFGYMNTSGTSDAGKFQEYRDMSDGFILDHFNFSATGKDNGYLNVEGGNVGRTDQYYNFNLGRYNDFRIRGFYDQVDHVYESNARLIFNGNGTNYLSLVPGLQYTGAPTGNAATNTLNTNPATAYQNVQSVVNGTAESTIDSLRKKGGLRIDKTFDDNWSVYASYSLEKRSGSQPYGQTGGCFPGAFNLTPGFLSAPTQGCPVEVTDPTNFTIHDLIAGTSWSDRQTSINAAVHASLFNDANKNVQWENPFVSPTISSNDHVQNFSTFPSNQELDAKFDFKHAFDGFYKSVVNANLYYAVQRQDDSLQPNTDSTGYLGTTAAPTVNLAYWNSLIGPNGLPTLSQQSADLHNNIWMFNSGWSLHPTDQLALKAAWRFYDQINDNSYVGFNPACAAAGSAATAAIFLTNPSAYCNVGATATPYGYIRENGIADLTTPLSLGQHVRSFSGSYKKVDTDLTADYQFSPKNSLNTNLEYETYNYTERERDQTNEAKLKLTFVTKEVKDGTLRVSAEYDKKTGSTWNQFGYIQAFCASPNVSDCVNNLLATAPNAPFVGIGGNAVMDPNPVGNKLDLADRSQYVLVGRFNYMFTPTLDGMITAKEQIQEYPDQLGRSTRRETGATAEINWQPTTTTNFYVYDTLQVMNQTQYSIQAPGAAGSACTNLQYYTGQCNYQPGAGLSVFSQIYNSFGYNTTDNDNVFGIGFSQLFENKVKFDASYQYTATRTSVDYADYCQNTPAANGCSAGFGGLGYAGVNFQVIPGIGTLPDQFSFPATTWDRQTLTLGLTVPISTNLTGRIVYTFDKATESDWHYNGLSSVGDTPGSRYYLTQDPAVGFTDNTIFAALNYKM